MGNDDDLRRARTSGWGQARKDIGETHPSENRVAFWQRLMERTMVLISNIAAGSLKSTLAQQAEFRLAIGEWHKDMVRCAEGSFWSCAPSP